MGLDLRDARTLRHERLHEIGHTGEVVEVDVEATGATLDAKHAGFPGDEVEVDGILHGEAQQRGGPVAA